MNAAPETHASRLRRLRRLMRDPGCTHLLLSDPIDCRYATGFRSSNVLLLIDARQGWLCTDFRYRTAAEGFCRRNRRTWTLQMIAESDYSFLRPLVPRKAALGTQPNAVTVEQFERLKRALPGVRFVQVPEATSAVSIVKTPAEIRAIGRCARMADTALRRTLPALSVGVTELQVRDILEEQCRRLGSQGPAFETIVLFGRRSALPHGVPSGARLKQGDFVLFDFGCTLDGMRSDMTRTVVKGKAGKRQRQVYNTVLGAQQRARRRVAPGVLARVVDGAARGVIEDAGFGREFGHATGHGVGYRIHEPPRLAARSTARLPAGSVVTVEPGIYIPSLGGVRIEDMVVPAGSGCRVLTRFPRQLLEV